MSKLMKGSVLSPESKFLVRGFDKKKMNMITGVEDIFSYTLMNRPDLIQIQS